MAKTPFSIFDWLGLGIFLFPLLMGRRTYQDPGLPRANGRQTNREKVLGLHAGDEALVPKLTEKWGDLARKAHDRHPSVPTSLILAVIQAESRGRPKEISPKGEEGLMQLTPQLQEDFGVSDPFDPWDNIEGGTEALSWMLAQFQGNVSLALIAFNWGPRRVTDFLEKKRDLPVDANDYVRRIRGLESMYQTHLLEV